MLELVERNINGTDHNVFKNAPPTLRDLINTVQLLMGDFHLSMIGEQVSI